MFYFFKNTERSVERAAEFAKPQETTSYNFNFELINRTDLNFFRTLLVQRYKTHDGKVVSPHGLLLPNGRYDINIVKFAVILYVEGVPANFIQMILRSYFGVNVSTEAILH